MALRERNENIDILAIYKIPLATLSVAREAMHLADARTNLGGERPQFFPRSFLSPSRHARPTSRSRHAEQTRRKSRKRGQLTPSLKIYDRNIFLKVIVNVVFLCNVIKSQC